MHLPGWQRRAHEVVDLLATGLFRGVTTNPAILDKAGLGSIDIPDVIRWATAAGAERVSERCGLAAAPSGLEGRWALLSAAAGRLAA